MILPEDKLEFEFFIILLLDDGSVVLERDNVQYLKKDILNSGKKVEKVLDYCLGYDEARKSFEYYKQYYKDLSK